MTFSNNSHASIYFNPLPRKEGDNLIGLIWVNRIISIHSLVKRETFVNSSHKFLPANFNPLPRKEGDNFTSN